ncbi:MAG: dienelactone hydrolase family protein [Saprospiraceae bacterium]|nr:dienelactone hydrolase family protein [Saprospiraceae bacterium]
MSIPQIEQFDKWSFSSRTTGGLEITHDVFSGGSGKVVVLIQELPGIGQETLALADRFVSRGYEVVLPHLFGPLGKTSMLGNFFRVCISKEFQLFAMNKSSPVVDWLKALCREVKQRKSVKGVAVIGMCLTGNFTISLMADDAVLAGYASQPSLPLLKQKNIHMSTEEIEAVRARLEEIGPMHCARFERDKLCKPTKFSRYENEFNHGGKNLIKFHELPGKGHAILTFDFVDQKNHPTFRLLEEIMEYFDRMLDSN